jgi:hypothetical protein
MRGLNVLDESHIKHFFFRNNSDNALIILQSSKCRFLPSLILFTVLTKKKNKKKLSHFNLHQHKCSIEKKREDRLKGLSGHDI